MNISSSTPGQLRTGKNQYFRGDELANFEFRVRKPENPQTPHTAHVGPTSTGATPPRSPPRRRMGLLTLDPDEMAAYEVWKEHELTTSVDHSVSAFNLEQETQALAWEAGWNAAQDAHPKEQCEKPYRAQGMSDERPVKKLTS